MQKIKLTFIIVVAMACGWYLRGFVYTITTRSASLQKTKGTSSPHTQTAINTTNFNVSSEHLRQSLSDLNKLYTQIRIVPYYDGDLPAGMKIFSIESSSLFEELGFVRGDIVESINNETLSLQNAMSIFEKLKSSNQFDIQVVRNGFKENFHYTLTE